jgi:predicted DNA-binding protein YlxM (UPF0122 family)
MISKQVSLETICDNLIDTQHLENENIKRLEEYVCEYKSLLELIGYYHCNNDIKEKLEKKIIILRIYIIKDYDNLLRTDYVYHLRLLISDIEKTASYKKGKHKYYSIRNLIIYNFKKELYDSFNNQNHEDIKKNITNIIKYDGIYDIYHDTISLLMKQYEPFKKIMINDYIDYIWI